MDLRQRTSDLLTSDLQLAVPISELRSPCSVLLAPSSQLLAPTKTQRVFSLAF